MKGVRLAKDSEAVYLPGEREALLAQRRERDGVPSVRRPGASWWRWPRRRVWRRPPFATAHDQRPVNAARTIEHVAGVDVRITRGDGKPLLLLTRMASGGMGIWDAIWDDLARHFTVANFDLVGVAALSEDLAPRERFGRLADSTADVATALGFDTFHVFGWYGGTHVALACMLRHADACVPHFCSIRSSSFPIRASSRRRSRSNAGCSRATTARCTRTTG